MAIWFALDHKLNLYNCCDCGDEEAALESALRAALAAGGEK